MVERRPVTGDREPPRAVALQRMALAGNLALIGLVVLRYSWLAPPPQVSPWLPLMVTLAPLLLPLPGMLARKRYTYKWAGFIALGYVAYAVDSLFIDGWSQPLGAAEMLAALMWFFAGMLYVRSTRA